MTRTKFIDEKSKYEKWMSWGEKQKSVQCHESWSKVPKILFIFVFNFDLSFYEKFVLLVKNYPQHDRIIFLVHQYHRIITNTRHRQPMKFWPGSVFRLMPKKISGSDENWQNFQKFSSDGSWIIHFIFWRIGTEN